MKIPCGLIFNKHNNENIEKDFRRITFDKNKIDWEKVWEKFNENTINCYGNAEEKLLQQLVEKSLRGEL